MLTLIDIEPGGFLQWIDAANFKAVQSQAMAPRDALQKGIETIHKWAGMLGRTLNECARLPDIFCANGLEYINHEIISSDNDPSTRTEITMEVSRGMQSLFARYAKMKGSGMSVEELLPWGKGC
jgi:hypothetical protein